MLNINLYFILTLKKCLIQHCVLSFCHIFLIIIFDLDWDESQGLGLLTLSAMLPSLRSTYDYIDTDNIMLHSTRQLQVILFFFSLYLVAVGQGGHKPCVQAFGADQFGLDHEECKAKKLILQLVVFWYMWGFCCNKFGHMLCTRKP